MPNPSRNEEQECSRPTAAGREPAVPRVSVRLAVHHERQLH